MSSSIATRVDIEGWLGFRASALYGKHRYLYDELLDEFGLGDFRA